MFKIPTFDQDGPPFYRWVLVHPVRGVYLGNPAGFDIWSTDAVPFLSSMFATVYESYNVAETMSKLEGMVGSMPFEVVTQDRGYATPEECEAAGLKGWQS